MSYRTELLLALFLATVITVAIVAGRRAPKPTPEDEPPSTLLTGPGGSKAPYEVLGRLHRPVERLRRPLFDLARLPRARRPALLVVVAPPIALQAAELDQVVDYVREGGTVVAAGNGGGITTCFGWRTRFSERAFAAESLRVLPPQPGLLLPRVVRYLVSQRDTTGDTTAGESPRRRLERLTRLRKETRCGGLGPGATDTLLRTRDGRPVIVRVRYAGGGSATLAADPAYFRNRAWRESDVPLLLVPLLTPAAREVRGGGGGGGHVVWDEYHHGHSEDVSLTGAVVRWVIATPFGWGLLQLAAAALVGLAVLAVRFGPARAVIERRRRSPLEHLEALAAGLETAAGADTAVQLTVAGLRRRLSRAGYVPRGDLGPWLAALELALPTAQGRAAARRLQAAISQPGGGERVLATAQAVEDVWEDLRPPTTRAAS
jgi:Domain of unknown function (DUF4350)